MCMSVTVLICALLHISKTFSPEQINHFPISIFTQNNETWKHMQLTTKYIKESKHDHHKASQLEPQSTPLCSHMLSSLPSFPKFLSLILVLFIVRCSLYQFNSTGTREPASFPFLDSIMLEFLSKQPVPSPACD